MRPFPVLHIYSPETFEDWDFRNPDTQGIGGSETCHIELAWRFAQRGYKVISYAPIPSSCPSLHKGVEWRHVRELNTKEDGLYIFIRDCSPLEDFVPSSTKRAWLICQDEDYDHFNVPTYKWEWNKEKREKLEKIIALSPAHLIQLQYSYPDCKEKIVLGTNGIRTDLIKRVLKEDIKRNPYRIIYFSSPLRGLIPLLTVFRRAREYVPDLELVIGYGFDNVDKIISEYPIAKYKKSQIEELLQQPNIVWKGRINQEALYREICSAGLWCYPTNFFETGCIASMEAQALGAIPIASKLGAISSNVRFGELIDGDIREGIILGRFSKALVEWSTQFPLQEFIRNRMMDEAQREFNWERTVDRYEGWVHKFGAEHRIIPHSIFQLVNSYGKIINIGCSIDVFGFENIGATNVDVLEKDPHCLLSNRVHILADARNIPVRDDSYDSAILGEILEHFLNDNEVIKALNEAKRIVKKGGHIIITVPEDHRTKEEQGKDQEGMEWYTEDTCGFHWRPITKELLFSWLDKTNLRITHYRPIDYGWFLGHGVVVEVC